MTIANVFTALQDIIAVIWDVFGDCARTIMNNPLLFVPVLLGIAGSLIFFAIRIVRKLGIKGVASSGGHRRRR